MWRVSFATLLSGTRSKYTWYFLPGLRRMAMLPSTSAPVAHLTASRPTAKASFASFSATTPGNERCK